MNKHVEKLFSILEANRIDAAIITEKNNIRYYSGFTSEDAVLLIHQAACYLITDFRYIEQAQKQCPDFNVIDAPGTKTAAFIKNTCTEQLKAKNIWFEDGFFTYRDYSLYKEILHPLNLFPDKGLISEPRLIKTEEEIVQIKKAAELADRGFLYILDYIRPGISEKEIALELEYFLKKNGSEDIAFPIIVASGKNGSLPHAEPSNKKIEVGEFVTLDFGCKISGYCSDMTRTVALGKPERIMSEIYHITLEAQAEALNIIGPGLTGREVDKQARDYISSNGYGDFFGHGLGHGVGLNIHEEPRLSEKGYTVLQPGMVVTVEPGIYLPDIGGVRIEDLVVITDEGYENLVSSKKDLIVL